MSDIMASLSVGIRKKVVYVEPVVEFNVELTDEMIKGLISWELDERKIPKTIAKRVLYKRYLSSDDYDEICFFKSIAPIAYVGDAVKYDNRPYIVESREINLDNSSIVYYIGSTFKNCKGYDAKLEDATRLYNGDDFNG